MEATIVPDRLNHYPVLLKEIISIISPQYGGTFIDCTFGQGGYSKEILKLALIELLQHILRQYSPPALIQELTLLYALMIYYSF